MDIAEWLRGLGLDQYLPSFRDNDIDGEMLRRLTAEDLRELGVTSLGHRKKLLAAIAALDAENASMLVDSASSASAPSAVTTKSSRAERRHLTVMFVDLAGSTALSTRLDPEEMREVLRAYHDAVAAGVMCFEGYVAKFMGDGVLAYFGWPQAHENEAERAVRAGLAIVEAVQNLPSGADRALSARIGIATGLVVVGDLVGEGAAQEEAVVGETPNIAARLQQLAPPGAVVIADSTRRLLGGLFAFDELAGQSLRGIDAPIDAFRVLRETAAESRFEAFRRSELVPLIGREHELALLLDRWGMADAGEGQLVLLSGEAGIGKSRLVLALRERLRDEPCSQIAYSCSPYHGNSALWPVITQLERAAGYARDETPAAKLEKLESLLQQAGKPGPDAVPLVAELLGLPLDSGRSSGTPHEKKGRIFSVLLTWLEGLARHRPMLVLLEDAHWLDPTTTEFFDRFADRIRGLPVLLVVTFRPEAVPSWARYPHTTMLSLNRLGRSGSQALIDQTARERSLPPAVVEAILARTEGVPLFVEELTKAVLESGVLTTAADGSFTLTGALPALAIPPTLQDSLLARLDRLAQAREAAQIAACIGREFDEEIVGAVAGLSESRLAEALDQLCRAELVQRHGTPPRHVYAFKHALVRDAAYATLLKSRRQQIHAQTAEAITRLRPEFVAGQPEILAHHFIEAGLPDKGAAYILEAGRLAKARHAIHEAVSQLETCQRLVAVSRGDAAAETSHIERESLLMLGDLMGLFEDLDRANGYYERAAALADTDAERRNARNRMHRLRFAGRDEARIAFYEHGSGEPTIIFINPIHFGLATFQPIVEQLWQEFRIITVDCRGTGRSDALVRPYGTLQHMEDLAAVIGSAGAAPVVAVGISAASSLVVQLAHHHPELVQKLVMMGAGGIRSLPGGGEIRPADYTRRRTEAANRGSLDEIAQVLAETAYSEPEEEELRRLFFERWRRLPSETLLSFVADPNPGMDISGVLDTLAVPVLVVHGLGDRMVNWQVSEYIASRIPGAELYFFERKGHNPLYSATDEFCRVLRNFIRTGSTEDAQLV